MQESTSGTPGSPSRNEASLSDLEQEAADVVRAAQEAIPSLRFIESLPVVNGLPEELRSEASTCYQTLITSIQSEIDQAREPAEMLGVIRSKAELYDKRIERQERKIHHAQGSGNAEKLSTLQDELAGIETLDAIRMRATMEREVSRLVEALNAKAPAIRTMIATTAQALRAIIDRAQEEKKKNKDSSKAGATDASASGALTRTRRHEKNRQTKKPCLQKYVWRQDDKRMNDDLKNMGLGNVKLPSSFQATGPVFRSSILLPQHCSNMLEHTREQMQRILQQPPVTTEEVDEWMKTYWDTYPETQRNDLYLAVIRATDAVPIYIRPQLDSSRAAEKVIQKNLIEFRNDFERTKDNLWLRAIRSRVSQEWMTVLSALQQGNVIALCDERQAKLKEYLEDDYSEYIHLLGQLELQTLEITVPFRRTSAESLSRTAVAEYKQEAENILARALQQVERFAVLAEKIQPTGVTPTVQAEPFFRHHLIPVERKLREIFDYVEKNYNHRRLSALSECIQAFFIGMKNNSKWLMDRAQYAIACKRLCEEFLKVSDGVDGVIDSLAKE